MPRDTHKPSPRYPFASGTRQGPMVPGRPVASGPTHGPMVPGPRAHGMAGGPTHGPMVPGPRAHGMAGAPTHGPMVPGPRAYGMAGANVARGKGTQAKRPGRKAAPMTIKAYWIDSGTLKSRPQLQSVLQQVQAMGCAHTSGILYGRMPGVTKPQVLYTWQCGGPKPHNIVNVVPSGMIDKWPAVLVTLRNGKQYRAIWYAKAFPASGIAGANVTHVPSVRPGHPVAGGVPSVRPGHPTGVFAAGKGGGMAAGKRTRTGRGRGGGIAGAAPGPSPFPGGGKGRPTGMQGFISEDKPWPSGPGTGKNVKPCQPGMDLVHYSKAGLNFAQAEALCGQLNSPYICAIPRKVPLGNVTHYVHKGMALSGDMPCKPHAWKKGRSKSSSRRARSLAAGYRGGMAGKPGLDKRSAVKLQIAANRKAKGKRTGRAIAAGGCSRNVNMSSFSCQGAM